MRWTVSHLGGRSVPAEVLCVRVVADVVRLALGTSGAEGQAVAVSPHLLHLQQATSIS